MENKTENIGTYADAQNKIISDNHEFIILPNIFELGTIDAEKALENHSIIINRAKTAFENRFFIEFLSLKLQWIEFYLKIYWVTKNPYNKTLDHHVQKFFGTLINECENFGFDAKLIFKLKEFNESRVKAVHKFLMGGTTEEELQIVSEKYSKLGNEISDYILNECGTFITDVSLIPKEVGTMIISRKNLNNMR